MDEESQACRELGEATANDAASEVDAASQPPRLHSGIWPAPGLCIVWSERFSQSIGGCYLEFLWVLRKGVLGVFSV